MLRKCHHAQRFALEAVALKAATRSNTRRSKNP
jgi:hypothetical protein